jgi:hypothetical protein
MKERADYMKTILKTKGFVYKPYISEGPPPLPKEELMDLPESGQPRLGNQTAEAAEVRIERPVLIVLCAPLRSLRPCMFTVSSFSGKKDTAAEW